MKKILIIGASQGIGAAIAGLAKKQFEIIAIGRHQPTQQTMQFYACDVLSDPLPVIDEPLSGLVYCPGSINLKPFSHLKTEDFRVDMEINLFSAIACLKQYQRNLQAAKTASVVLFSSVAAQTGLPYHSVVAASKGAVEGLTHALAAEWAPDVRVNAIAPSLTETPLSERLVNDDRKKQAVEERHPMQRIGQPNDIAEMALFLLSEKSSWITGQVIHVDGGISIIRQ